jgi:hypothetical protein
MGRIEAQPDAAENTGSGDHFFARLRVATTAGEVFEHYVDRPLGRDRDHPLPEGTLEAKFVDCARIALDPDSTEALVHMCGELETVDDLAAVVDIIAAGVKPRRASEPFNAERGRAYA